MGVSIEVVQVVRDASDGRTDGQTWSAIHSPLHVWKTL